ncbi:MAG: hypothetical protein GY789_27780 [Hyphomicrobiales bacterium]|nr:hypothetical protein [Hyphomicrobiales bacterium]
MSALLRGRIDGRRCGICGVLLVAFAILVSGHTPYSQWNVYRQEHLLILTHKDDSQGYELGKSLATHLAKNLPSSQARVTRAPNLARVASLITTGQLDLALLRKNEARALINGQTPFAYVDGKSLRAIAIFDDFVLVSRADFPAAHAYRVAESLALGPDNPSVAGTTDKGSGLVIHPGVLAFLKGQPRPEFVNRNDGSNDHDHDNNQ